MRALTLFGFGVVTAIGSTGCVVETSSPPPPATVAESGTFVLDWTIDGSTDPNRCNQSSAATIDIRVYAGGGLSGEYQQACTSFATSISLAPGTYSADAAFVDGAGTERTTRVPINAFTIRGNDTLDIGVDFPASSYY